MNPKHLKGAINELKAQIWFLNNDYQIFTPTVQQGIIDFVAYKEKQFKGVQVKSAYDCLSGPHKYITCRLGRSTPGGRNKITTRAYDYNSDDDYFDILFVIYNDKKWLIPRDQIPKNKKTLYFNENTRNIGYNPNAWVVSD